MTKPQAPDQVCWIAQTLEEAGFETWTVGGAVRDALFGIPSEDWDLTTRATPTEVKRVFGRTIPIGIDHGTVGVLSRDGVLYEITTFRRDIETTGRRAVVEFSDTLDEDLARRDFTINAVAWHPLREVFRDPFDGKADLKRGVLRTVGDPGDRFTEDYLRILRALRFAGAYRLTIERETWLGLTASVHRMDILSPERLREELERVLTGETPPSRSMALYAASGVLGFLYPELDALVGFLREPGSDWFAHSLRAIDLLSPHRPVLRWAALFQGVGEHDGSPGAGEEGNEPHDRALRRSAAVLERLRSPNAIVSEVAGLTQWIARPPGPEASGEELRRWLSAVGRNTLNSLLRIWIACLRADEVCGGSLTHSQFMELCRRLRAISQSDVPLTVAELGVSGRDLIRMGYAPGPHFGEVLDHLLDRTLEDPSLNQPALLQAEIEEWMQHGESYHRAHEDPRQRDPGSSFKTGTPP